MHIHDLQRRVHETSLAHGWWDHDRNIGELLALIHSEISEALEEYRNVGKDRLTRIRFLVDGGPEPKPEGFFVELADAVIRIADVFEHFGVDMASVLELKMRYNEIRPHRHGGKHA